MNDSNNKHNSHGEFITPDNVVMLFIDHQAAIMTGIGDMDPVRFRNNVIALAKTAKLHKLPTVLSDNMPEGFAGPILLELVEILPDAPLIHRAGPINAWDDPAFVKAVAATGADVGFIRATSAVNSREVGSCSLGHYVRFDAMSHFPVHRMPCASRGET